MSNFPAEPPEQSTAPNKPRPQFQFGIRHLLLWTVAIAAALMLGRIKERYEPYLGDVGQLAILLAILVLGVSCGAATGRKLFRREGAVAGSVIGVLVIFGVFLVCVTYL